MVIEICFVITTLETKGLMEGFFHCIVVDPFAHCIFHGRFVVIRTLIHRAGAMAVKKGGDVTTLYVDAFHW